MLQSMGSQRIGHNWVTELNWIRLVWYWWKARYIDRWGKTVSRDKLIIVWLNNFWWVLRQWASLVAQTVENLPAMQETWVWSLGWEDSPGGHGNPLQYSCLENPHGQKSLAGYSLWGCKESDMTEWLSTSTGLIPFHFITFFFKSFLCTFIAFVFPTKSWDHFAKSPKESC